MAEINWKSDATFWALALLSLTLSLSIGISNAAVLILIATMFFSGKFRVMYSALKEDWMALLILSYFFLIAANLIREDSIESALSIVEKRILILLPICFLGLRLNPISISRLLRYFLISCIVAIMVSFYNTLQQSSEIDSLYSFSWYLSRNSIISSNYLAFYCGFALLVLIYRSFSNPLFKVSVTIFFGFTLFGFLLVLGSRMAFFSTMIISLGIVFMRLPRRHSIILTLVLAVTVAVLITTIPYFHNRIMVLFTVGFEADPRYYEYKAATSLVLRNPWIGHGITGTEQLLVEEYKRLHFHEGVAQGYNSHNQFLQTTAMFGLPGLAILLSILILMIWRSIVGRKYLATVFVLHFSLGCLTECLLERNKGILIFAFVTGIFLMREKQMEIQGRPG